MKLKKLDDEISVRLLYLFCQDVTAGFDNQ